MNTLSKEHSPVAAKRTAVLPAIIFRKGSAELSAKGKTEG